jgi:phosphonate transport system substrate-binding protein
MKEMPMKQLKIFFIISFIWLCLTSLIYADDDRIVIGIDPWQKPEAMYDMYNPLVQYIGQQLQKKAILIVVKKYEYLPNMIKNQKIDVGIFSPNMYVEAKEQVQGLKYIVTLKTNFHGEIRDHYKSVIIVSKGSPFHTLQDLKGKRFAFTNKHSTSGYIFPNMVLKEKGIDYKTYFSEVFWLKKHNGVTNAIVNNSVDAGATFDNHIQREIEIHGDAFRIIAESPPIPNGAAAAGPHISDATCKKIRKALINLLPDAPANQATVRGGVGLGGYTIRNDQFYDIIRKVKKQ